MMQFRDLVVRSRSIRRFDESVAVQDGVLRDLVELACYVPSPKNLQPLKFIARSGPDCSRALFPLLSWAGYLADWPGPEAGERPTAYIVMLGDTSITSDFSIDSGIAAEVIMLGAASIGLGGCIIASIDRPALQSLLHIPDRYQILQVLALGKPVETVVIDQIGDGDPVRYYRDPNGIHHVPKRTPGDILLDFSDDPG
ncbi:nitroreductase family protein [Pelodictyon luteolum]|uniref:Nitroreductase family protein n=1 Tax=Chlorobium luteolum (strain DSM 273 / BCRC 81028 / 2530) TaxID=319225 RepID=Q3B5N8_CHLL3|nr:nitroreductase family protein [Pelodictyon luteolum DSM 273]